ncbi:hypothetical protein [Aidingimonas halophila]|uniref:Group II intron, maturase-specific domain n=1 Tax=Aidingimonas halophila TaxID=574349 RepID=A0A1H3A143_9GAMM|nr:hypothetical protein [Aidingimonas halophila]SDX22639.1 hypothetical protein SAMN05443545_104306 [Aidingimonas halophila]
MASLRRFVDASLRLTVNPRKSAVDRPWNRRFLGFTISRRGVGLKVADKAIDRLKHQVCQHSRRTRGHSIVQVIAELRETQLGWKDVLRRRRGAEPAAGPGQVDQAAIAGLPLEAMGQSGLP